MVTFWPKSLSYFETTVPYGAEIVPNGSELYSKAFWEAHTKFCVDLYVFFDQKVTMKFLKNRDFFENVSEKTISTKV